MATLIRCALLARRLALRLSRGLRRALLLLLVMVAEQVGHEDLHRNSTRPAEIPHGDREHLDFDRTSSAGGCGKPQSSQAETVFGRHHF